LVPVRMPREPIRITPPRCRSATTVRPSTSGEAAMITEPARSRVLIAATRSAAAARSSSVTTSAPPPNPAGVRSPDSGTRVRAPEPVAGAGGVSAGSGTVAGPLVRLRPVVAGAVPDAVGDAVDDAADEGD